jgi:hypothetical protein
VIGDRQIHGVPTLGSWVAIVRFPGISATRLHHGLAVICRTQCLREIA